MNGRDTGHGLLLVAIAAAVLIGGTAAASHRLNVDSSVLTDDPASLADAPFYLGGVTMLRTALLAGAAAVCLVTASVVRGHSRRLGEFLGVFGLFSAVLVLDDQFQGHEEVLDAMLGVPQPLTFAAYAAVLVPLAFRYRRLVLSLPSAGALLCAFPCFAFAIAADTFDYGVLFTSFTEASAELLGILCLAVFGLQVSLSTLQSATQAPADVARRAVEPSAHGGPSSGPGLDAQIFHDPRGATSPSS